jgi:type I restriction enzyme, S subunit
MHNWETTKANDFCLSVRDGTHDSPKRVNDGKYLITSRHIISGVIDLTNAYLISNSDYDEVNRRSKVDRWDVLFTMIGTVGEVCLVKNEPNFAIKNIGLFKSKNELNGKWLYYFLQSKKTKQLLDSLKRGTTQAYIPLGELRNLNISYPTSINEAQNIISVLGALDDKIENNRRMNETLEEMARAIFKSWFVDFDPVHAKAAGNAPAHMDAETAKLFPSSFDDDGLPVGWEWQKLGDCVSLTKGRSYKSSELQESDTALVSLKSFMRGGGYRPDGLKAYTGIYKEEQTLTSGDLIVALTDVTQAADVIGKPAIVRSNNQFKTLVASLDVGVVRPTVSSVSKAFLYCMMMTHDFQAHIYGHTSGTTVLHLGKAGVPTYEFGMPACEVLDKFTAIAQPIFSKIEMNEVNSITLAELRDTLLPKLMSGEIRVKDAERTLEEAV